MKGIMHDVYHYVTFHGVIIIILLAIIKEKIWKMNLLNALKSRAVKQTSAKYLNRFFIQVIAIKATGKDVVY